MNRSRCVLIASFALCIVLTGCARVVVDYHDALKDGGKLEFPLKPGRYRIEMAATGDGASVQWQGCDCGGTGPVKRWKQECRLPYDAKVVVRNPSVLHLGKDARLDLKITKLP
ncbi:MAG: hypothetical protein U0704_12625 [Candidatus Eisenbacteria bacterium]